MRSDNGDVSASGAQSDGTNHARLARDEPPLYLSGPAYSRTKTLSRGLEGLQPNIQASNFQTVKYRMPISGTYVIDPSLEIPEDLASDNPDRNGVSKKTNLSLECTRGSITADIWLVKEKMPAEGSRKRDVGRAVVDVHCKSWLGKVSVKLYSISTHPFSLSASSNGGDISIALPSDFVGPITLSTGSLYDSLRPSSFTPFASSGVSETTFNGPGCSEVRTVPFNSSISFSDAVKSRLVTFSEVGGKRSCFIGDYRTANYKSGKDWNGSVVDIQSCYGSLRISFVDEPQEREQAGGCIVM